MNRIKPKEGRSKKRGGAKVWRIDYFHPSEKDSNGRPKRKQHEFEDKTKALQKAQELNEAFQTDLSPEETEDALAALHLLRASPTHQGSNLRKAVEFFITHYRAIATAPTLREAITEYLTRKEANCGAKSDTFKNTANFLREFEKLESDLLDSNVASLTNAELQAYLDSFDKSYPQRRRYIIELFNFLCKDSKDYASPWERLPENPATHLRKPPRRESEIEILTIDEVKRVLECAIEHRTIQGWAWLLFTAMRPKGEFIKFWKTRNQGWRQIANRRVNVVSQVSCLNPTFWSGGYDCLWAG